MITLTSPRPGPPPVQRSIAEFYPSSIHQCTYWPDRPGPPHTVATRLATYRRWIAAGWFLNVRAAHAADRALYRRWLAREYADSRRVYQALVAAHAFRNYRLHRSLLFAWPRRCAYCGAPAVGADHVIPRAQGGSDHFDNLAPACKRCNGDKNDRTPEQWIAWRRSRGLPWPMPGTVYCPRP